MARPKRQDERRAYLLAATRAAIMARGLAGVRVRDIADAAGMSPGTVTYYFRDVQDLFADVYDEAVERFYARRSQAAEQHEDPARRLAGMIDSGLPSGPDDELCCLLYEFSPQARMRRGEAVMRRSLFDRQADLYERILRDGADSQAFSLTTPPTDAARNLVALEDAYGYHIITGTSVDRKEALRLMTGYAAHVVGVEV
ncbi:TetR/AcrR family transcriptional regulator [Catellatospora bangladeshensis]|uniref:TetR family transcriptional regulator n=1 Tax=Catellatospora bangladeshensis TaxID=310355 RepID=A0A8J3NN68_9ACTN|nr:TetR/AcrR family transcriptional regulator [Catellatospora bangladeshensis]GIF84560.1 TetR family transcriptional regulator [Catellatospora bangladeshensis]